MLCFFETPLRSAFPSLGQEVMKLTIPRTFCETPNIFVEGSSLGASYF